MELLQTKFLIIMRFKTHNNSKVNKHNLRKYDDKVELIEIICGTNNLYEDVKLLVFSYHFYFHL